MSAALPVHQPPHTRYAVDSSLVAIVSRGLCNKTDFYKTPEVCDVLC